MAPPMALLDKPEGYKLEGTLKTDEKLYKLQIYVSQCCFIYPGDYKYGRQRSMVSVLLLATPSPNLPRESRNYW